MGNLNATELAAKLGLSKPRISQYVNEGKLDGCFVGEGRARRFDLGKVAEVLGRQLDLGQMSGNGRETRRALRSIAQQEVEPGTTPAPSGRTDGALSPRDPDRLELATLQIKEEDARRKRRENARDEGLWVLAEEVQRQSAAALAKELALFEGLVRDMARAVADRMGVDYRAARTIMMDQFRQHRTKRAQDLAGLADAAPMTDAEKVEQV